MFLLVSFFAKMEEGVQDKEAEMGDPRFKFRKCVGLELLKSSSISITYNLYFYTYRKVIELLNCFCYPTCFIVPFFHIYFLLTVIILE